MSVSAVILLSEHTVIKITLCTTYCNNNCIMHKILFKVLLKILSLCSVVRSSVVTTVIFVNKLISTSEDSVFS